MYLSAVEPLVNPGQSPPSGPAIQCGKKFECVVGESRLGRLAATTTSSRLPATTSSSATAARRVSVRARATAPALRRSRQRRESPTSRSPSPAGSVDASLDIPSAGATISRRERRGPAEASPRSRSGFRRSDRLDVYGLGSLVALLGVVGHLRTLLQRPVALTVDSGVVDKQVLVAVIGCDEAEPLVVAEPLDCASWHVVFPPRFVRAAPRRMLLRASTCERVHCFCRSLSAGQTPRR